MLLYLASPDKSTANSESFLDKTLYDASNNAIYTFSTRTIWKSDLPSVPSFRQTDIAIAATGNNRNSISSVDLENQSTPIAHIDWDGQRPVYVDLGHGDERLVHDMVIPRAILPGKLIFETPFNPRWTWELTTNSMVLKSSTMSLLARYHPHARVTTEGNIEPVSLGSAKAKTARDWLEINSLDPDFAGLPIAELLVNFILLDSYRRIYFAIEDPKPTKIITTKNPHRAKSPSPTQSESLSLQQRLRQAVF